MEIVFLIIPVRQALQKLFRLGCTRQFPCQFAQKRRPHPDDRFRRDGGHQFALERLIFFVLQGKQLFCDLHFASVSLSFLQDTQKLLLFLHVDPVPAIKAIGAEPALPKACKERRVLQDQLFTAWCGSCRRSGDSAASQPCSWFLL